MSTYGIRSPRPRGGTAGGTRLSGKHAAIDGKRLRGMLEAASGDGALHLVNALCARTELSLGHVRADLKSKKSQAIPKLPDPCRLRGTTVIVDVIRRQRASRSGSS